MLLFSRKEKSNKFGIFDIVPFIFGFVVCVCVYFWYHMPKINAKRLR